MNTSKGLPKPKRISAAKIDAKVASKPEPTRVRSAVLAFSDAFRATAPPRVKSALLADWDLDAVPRTDGFEGKLDGGSDQAEATQGASVRTFLLTEFSCTTNVLLQQATSTGGSATIVFNNEYPNGALKLFLSASLKLPTVCHGAREADRQWVPTCPW